MKFKSNHKAKLIVQDDYYSNGHWLLHKSFLSKLKKSERTFEKEGCSYGYNFLTGNEIKNLIERETKDTSLELDLKGIITEDAKYAE